MFDNLSKFLAENYSQDFASWLIGRPITLTELEPTELSIEPIRADTVILLESDDLILHCEFQTDPDPLMPLRMADYAIRIFRRFPNKRLIQIVIYLRKTRSPAVYKTTFSGNNLVHQFQVIRIWEQPTESFLERPGLLPYAALTKTKDSAAILRQVAQRIDEVGDRAQRSNLSAATGILAGLSLERGIIQRILRRDLMRESVIYQELREEVSELEREKGRAEGRAEEGRSLVLRQLARRVGTLPAAVQSQVEALPLTQLETLGEDLLDFTSLIDLENWLAQ
jgi:predicted transposase/invertase (TIGR01784 family)